MQKKLFLLASAAAVVLLMTSCAGKLDALSTDCFNVTPNPLEAQTGEVPVTINGLFPEKYMNRKAVVTVTPELRYRTQEGMQTVKGTSATFQGEKVQGNDQTVRYLIGGRYTMKSNFKYVPEMQQSDLYLTFDAKIGNKKVDVPELKVATGVIATSELYHKTVSTARPATAPDAFQRVIEKKLEANIKFLVGQAQLRKSELQNNSVQEFVRLIGQIAKDQEGMAIDGVEVSAYASPEGRYDFNDQLADRRQSVTTDFLRQQMKQQDTDVPIDTKYTAEDWEGFQQLVAASDIQDKDVILRVLRLYQDPEEREQQIKNISVAFQELADGILPELRRARMTINYLVIGRDDEQILSQIKENPAALSLEELLYGATLYENDLNAQEATYKLAIKYFPKDARAYSNVAMIEYAKGNYTQAQSYAEQALKIDPKQAEANANLGLMALQQGDLSKAEDFVAKGSQAKGLEEVMGNLHLAQGKYAQAEQDFGKVISNSAALAQIMNKNYAQASKTLKQIAQPDGMTEYLKAIVAARTGKKEEAAQALKLALTMDPSLSRYAQQDLELRSIQ